MRRRDEEGVATPRYIPARVLPQEDLDSLMAARAGVAPGIIYARGVPVNPSPDPASFDRKDFSLILFEIGLCRATKKIEKYYLLLYALRR